MPEQITAITEQQDRPGRESWVHQDGFLILTNEQEIWLGIDNEQSCCEDWGYLLSEDDPQKFVGAELRGITATDTNRTNRRIVRDWEPETYDDEDEAVHLDCGSAMFIDLETDRGVLQFVAYNGHNGYYGHEVTVESRQLKIADTL